MCLSRKQWQEELCSLLLFSSSALTTSDCAVCLVQSKRLVVPKRSWSAMWHFEYPEVFSGCRTSVSIEICWGAPRLVERERKNDTEKGQSSGNSCFCCQLPLVVFCASVATSDEVIKGLFFQSCQPSVFLEQSSDYLETEFQKALEKQAVLDFQNMLHEIWWNS